MPTVLTVVGLIATVGFGVWAIALASSNRYPVRLVFAVDQCIGLLDPLARAIPGLEVRFGGAPIDRNLVLLRACVFNDGKRDITSSMVEDPLALSLPPGYTWLDARATESASGVRATLECTDERTLTTTFGLLKRGEYFWMECLVEAPPRQIDGRHTHDAGSSVLEVLTFRHRIADTGPVQRLRLDERRRASAEARQWFAARVVLPSVFGVALLWTAATFEPWQLRYLVPGPDQQVIETRITPRRDGQLLVKAVSGDFERVLAPDSVFRPPSPRALVVPQRFRRLIPATATVFFTVVVVLSGISAYWDIRRYKRYREAFAQQSGLSRDAPERGGGT